MAGRKQHREIFFCYSRKDGQRVDKIRAELMAQGYEVFMDVHELGPGPWRPQIENAIGRCRLFFVFLSRDFIKDQGFHWAELIKAIEGEKLRPPDEECIMPVLLDDTGLPQQLEKYQTFTWYDDTSRMNLYRFLGRALPRRKLGIAQSLDLFWSEILDSGCVIVLGCESLPYLGHHEVRTVVGKDDLRAHRELVRFLARAIKTHRPGSRTSDMIETAYAAMPQTIDRSNTAVQESIRRLEETLRGLGRNIVAIGMPCVNPASELVLTIKYGVDFFNPSVKGSPPRLPNGYIVADSRREPKSTLYYGRAECGQQGIWNSSFDQRLVEYHGSNTSGGILLKTEYNGRPAVVIAGFNGAATRAGVQLLTEMPEEVEFINVHGTDTRFADGFLYKVEYETVPQPNQEYEEDIKRNEIMRVFP